MTSYIKAQACYVSEGHCNHFLRPNDPVVSQIRQGALSLTAYLVEITIRGLRN